MIIESVPYTHMDDIVGFSISASLWMLLISAGYDKYQPQDINEMFCHTFISKEFYDHFRASMHIRNDEISEAVSCALYLVNEQMKDIQASIFSVDLPAIKYSFIKRHIPVMITGSFPIRNDFIQNSIVVKGYVDDYFVVNDPRGDAYSMYQDRLGENHLYRIPDLAGWLRSGKTNIFRLHI